MTDDNDLFNYVQTLLEDREVPGEVRVRNAMEPIEAQVRAEFGIAPDESIGGVPPEWEHKVPKDRPPLGTPGILMLPAGVDIDDVKFTNFDENTVAWVEEHSMSSMVGLDVPEFDYEPKKRWWHDLFAADGTFVEWWRRP